MLIQQLFTEAQNIEIPEEALKKFEELQQIVEAQLGSFSMGHCEVLAYMSGLQFDVKKFEESIGSAKKALNILVFENADDPIIRSQLYNNIAMSYWALEQKSKAKEHFEYLWRFLQKQKDKQLLEYGTEDYKNFCYQNQEYEKLVEIAASFDVSPIVYTHLKDNQPVIFENIIFCCSDPKHAKKGSGYPLGKVLYFQLIPLSIQYNVSIVFDKEDKERESIEKFSKSLIS